jgi:hypothetical protein
MKYKITRTFTQKNVIKYLKKNSQKIYWNNEKRKYKNNNANTKVEYNTYWNQYEIIIILINHIQRYREDINIHIANTE